METGINHQERAIGAFFFAGPGLHFSAGSISCGIEKIAKFCWDFVSRFPQINSGMRLGLGECVNMHLIGIFVIIRVPPGLSDPTRPDTRIFSNIRPKCFSF